MDHRRSTAPAIVLVHNSPTEQQAAALLGLCVKIEKDLEHGLDDMYQI